jgi:hypothetical protein
MPKAYGDTGYTQDEYQFLENLVQRQHERIIELGRAGKIPLRAMIAAVEPHEAYLVTKVLELGVPEHYALGMAVLENGGRTNAMSRARCKGIMQLSRPVAIDYGAIQRGEKIVSVKGRQRKSRVWIDRRDDPEINIEAGLRYLRDLYQDFFDWDFAAQAYHAGHKRVKQGISRYLEATGKKKIPWHAVDASVVKEHEINWVKFMQNPSTFHFFRRLHDETEYYLPKALACYRIYTDREKLPEDIPFI